MDPDLSEQALGDLSSLDRRGLGPQVAKVSEEPRGRYEDRLHGRRPHPGGGAVEARDGLSAPSIYGQLLEKAAL